MSMTVSKISEYLKTVVGMINDRTAILGVAGIAFLCHLVISLFGAEIFSTIMFLSIVFLFMHFIVYAKKHVDSGESFKFGEFFSGFFNDKEGLMYLLKKEKVDVDGKSAAEGQPEPTDSGK